MSYNEAYELTLTTLKTFANTLKHKNGFFYHFVDINTGERVWNSEISSMDTAIFIAGALTAGQFFENTEVTRLAQSLYERINWTWMTNGKDILCMGWKPETGFLPYYWDSFNESMLAYILACGSPTHGLTKRHWEAWRRPIGRYGNHEFIYSETGSLFVYQYPHVWINFKDIKDRGVNYWDNTIQATYANRQFCIDHQNIHQTYGPNSWGLSASLGPQGYKGYGAKPGNIIHDGTVAPYASAASLPLTPEISIPALQNLYEAHGSTLYGFYGFRDAFNIDRSWFADKYIGINQGLTVTMIENYLTQLTWQHFMKTDAFKKWYTKCISTDIGNTD